MMQRIFLLLPAILAMTELVKANMNETLPKPHVIIVGPTGAGKSSLACSLIGGDPTSKNCLFPVCDGMDSCTKNTSYCGNSTWIGEVSNPLFTIVDTPGFEDTDDEMAILLEEMTKVLNEDVKTADVVLLTFDAETVRFTSGLIDMLKQLEMLFGRVMWNSTMVEISKFSYKQSKIDERKEECDDPDLPCRDETFFYNEINKKIEENFHLGMNLSMVFIDSYARRNSSMDDEVQQEHFIAETDKLWDFALNSSEFKFKTIDQVLAENAIMKEELICLNGVIDDELKDLKAMLEKETRERQGNDSALQKEMEEEIEKIVDFPLGTIIAWVYAPEKNNEHPAFIPDGWTRCDGSVITEGQWSGKTTPNLNSENRFLRGGADDEILDFQEDAIVDHEHYETAHSHGFADLWRRFTNDPDPDIFERGLEDGSDMYGEHDYRSGVTDSVSGIVGKVKVGGNVHASTIETRPKNMKVVWLMRTS